MQISRRKFCECGCGQRIKKDKRFSHGHNKPTLGKGKPKSPPQLCKCGCGRMTKAGRQFISSHNLKCLSKEALDKKSDSLSGKNHYRYGIHLSQEIKNKISKGLRITLATEEQQQRMSRERKGRKAWNKNIPMRENSKRKLSYSLLGNCNAVGHVPSEETKRLWSEQRKGRKAWNKGITGYTTIPCSKEKALAISNSHKKRWQDPEFAARRGKEWQIKPNKPESFLMGVLDELYPNEWRYTGDFSFIINGKSPDFTNINGQKKLIELFGDYWHKGENPKDRARIFKPFGYQTLVIWESELKNIKKVISRIKRFSEKRIA